MRLDLQSFAFANGVISTFSDGTKNTAGYMK